MIHQIKALYDEGRDHRQRALRPGPGNLPQEYMAWVAEQARTGELQLGEITDPDDLASNLAENAIPDFIGEVTAHNYAAFLDARRKLMAGMIREYYEVL